MNLLLKTGMARHRRSNNSNIITLNYYQYNHTLLVQLPHIMYIRMYNVLC